MGDEIRVLVVEDDENVRFGVQQAVELAGLPVSAYAGAADALAEVAPGAPLVIVSDVRMPGIDGLQLLDKVMAIDPGDRYLDKYYSDNWLAEQGLDVEPYVDALERLVGAG